MTKKQKGNYRARSLRGAERRVRDLQKQILVLNQILNRYEADRLSLAKLAANTPMFYNPLEAMAAEKLRDDLLDPASKYTRRVIELLCKS